MGQKARQSPGEQYSPWELTGLQGVETPWVEGDEEGTVVKGRVKDLPTMAPEQASELRERTQQQKERLASPWSHWRMWWTEWQKERLNCQRPQEGEADSGEG